MLTLKGVDSVCVGYVCVHCAYVVWKRVCMYCACVRVCVCVCVCVGVGVGECVYTRESCE